MGFLIMGVIGYVVKLSKSLLLEIKKETEEGCANGCDHSPHSCEQHPRRRRVEQSSNIITCRKPETDEWLGQGRCVFRSRRGLGRLQPRHHAMKVNVLSIPARRSVHSEALQE